MKRLKGVYLLTIMVMVLSTLAVAAPASADSSAWLCVRPDGKVEKVVYKAQDCPKNTDSISLGGASWPARSRWPCWPCWPRRPRRPRWPEG